MSVAPKLCEKPCETCAKEGLPILLTRYALMPTETKAPSISGALLAPELQKVPLGNTAHYGLRLLRSGYVNVFDEARNHWDEYFVTTDGCLSKMPPRSRAFKVRVQPATEFSCARNGVAPLAGLITIRNPKHATKVWVAFSNVEWTDAVLALHQDAAHREKHMQCITIAGGKVQPQPRTAPISELGKWIAEFAMEAGTAIKAFGNWCPHPFNARKDQVTSTQDAIAKVRPEGGAAIVALHDPVGLALEIAALMEVRKVVFMNHESVAKPRFSASSIASLEQGIKEQAKLSVMAQRDYWARAADAGPADYNPNPALYGEHRDAELAKAMRKDPSQKELEQAAEQQWRQYTHDRMGKPRFSAAASQAWMASYNETFKKFDAEHIAPLAVAHASWMKHRCMVSHMSCNYDSGDKESGVAYTATIAELLRHTTDKRPSYDQYLAWLKNGEFTEENLIMRAMGFNQKELIDKLKNAHASPVDLRAFPTDAVAGAVDEFMEKMPSQANAVLSNLMAGLSGPALKYWDDFNAGIVGTKAAAAMAAMSGKQFVRLPIRGNRGQFVQAFVQQIYLLDPDLKANHNQLQKAVAAQIRLLNVQGVEISSRRELGWYVLLDKEAVSAASNRGLTGQALADDVARSVRTPEDIKKIDMARAMKLRTGMVATATVLTGVLMLLNYRKLTEDVEKGMGHELVEAKAKLISGTVAIGGFVAEKFGEQLEKLGETRLRNMAGRIGAFTPRALVIVGRFAGLGAGIFVGMWDIGKGLDERAKGDPSGLSKAYFFNGAAGISIAGALFASSMGWIVLGPVGWLILGLAMLGLLLVTLFIETHKDNKLQEWLSRCHFGLAADKYRDAATEHDEYKLALG